MGTQDGGHRETAIDALAAREYERAGDEYTRAGRRVLADPRPELDPFEPDERGWVGQGLGDLLAAVVAYRVAGADERATHRGVEGVAAARDLQQTLTHPAQRACLDELIADFRAAAGLDGADDAYEAAITAYTEAGADIEQPQVLGTSPLFEAVASPLKQVARGQDNGEIAITWQDLHGDDPGQPGQFLAHRPRYKRQRFQSLVEQAVNDGHLAAPRGTTEYENDNHRCPNCGAVDVNWAGSGVLCLRCSTPVERL